MQRPTAFRSRFRRAVRVMLGSLATGSVALAASAQTPRVTPVSATHSANAVGVVADAPSTYQVEVRMKGLHRRGVVRGGLYDGPGRWPDKDGSMAICTVAVTARTREATCTFTIPARPGLYAAAFFEDEDGDRVFDTNWLGIPIEGYAFSRDAHAALSAPSFERAAFRVPVQTPVVATMRY